MGLENLQNYIIGVIIFIGLITGGLFMVGSFYNADNSLDVGNNIQNFNKTLSKSSEITSSVNSIENSIGDVSTENSGTLGWLNVLVGSVFNGLRATFGTLSFLTVAVTESAGLFGIPTFIIAILVLVVTVIIGFAIWNAIMRV